MYVASSKIVDLFACDFGSAHYSQQIFSVPIEFRAGPSRSAQKKFFSDPKSSDLQAPGHCIKKMPTERLLDLLKAPKLQWNKIIKRLRDYSTEDAEYVDPETKMTVVHCVLLKRQSQNFSHATCLDIVTHMLKINPKITTIQCKQHGYTPLLYASSTSRDLYSLTKDAEIVDILLKAGHPSTELCGEDKQSALALHIRSISRLQNGMFAETSNAKEAARREGPSTAVLKILVQHCSRKLLEQGLEALFACNTLSIMERFAKEEDHARCNIQRFGRQTRASLADYWIWEWALIILRGIHNRIYGNRKVPFYALHVASQITDCPTPFLTFAMRTCPSEVRAPDRTKLNLPIHNVASWKYNGEGENICRKSMSLTSLVAEYPASIDVKNKDGESPIELEKKSGFVVQ